MTYHRAQWGYCYGGGSIWWFLGIIAGGSLELTGPALIAIMHYAGPVLIALFCVAAPFLGVCITRCIMRHIAFLEKQRQRKLRGPSYADYAYIL